MTGTSIALFGCGVWGRAVLRTLARFDCRVVVVDPDPAAIDYARRHGASRVAPSASGLAFDAAIVATPATTHYEVVSGLVDRGVPVFVEKPFTTNGADALALVEKAGDRLFPMHIWRYHPGIVRLASSVSSGAFGKVLGVRTFRTNWTSPRTDVGAEWTLLPHDLTICLALLGRIPALRHVVFEGAPDRVNGLLACYGNEPWFVAEVSNRYANKNRQVRVHLESAVLVLEHGEADRIVVLKGAGRTPEADWIPVDATPALEIELKVFLEYVAGGERPACDAAEALEIVRQVESVRKYIG